MMRTDSNKPTELSSEESLLVEGLNTKGAEFIRKHRSSLLYALGGLAFMIGVASSHSDESDIHTSSTTIDASLAYLDGPTFSYVVQSGDGLSVLFARLGIPYNSATVSYFCELNPDYVNVLDGHIVTEGKYSTNDLRVDDEIVLWGDESVFDATASYQSSQE